LLLAALRRTRRLGRLGSRRAHPRRARRAPRDVRGRVPGGVRRRRHHRHRHAQALARLPPRGEETLSMRERRVGNSGLHVSVVGLGCNNFGWRLDAEQTRRVVHAALEAGVTLFDTAESYGDGESERFLGRALAGRRADVVIATKFGGRCDTTSPGGSAENVRWAIDGSLERLGTDYVDLYQYHRPDGVTPIEETLGALEELVEAGKVRHVGSSNFSAAEVRAADGLAHARGWSPFISAQNEYSLLKRDVEAELVPTLEELGLGLIPYFPLASGLLTGKYRHGAPAPAGTRLEGRGVPDDAATWDR